jgi:murein DD-endopeptidase MepM/ murein hydrolase activator NlpD
MKSSIAFTVLCVFFLSCKHQSHENNETLSVEAKYVLPYPVGREYTCLQGFNDPYSHNGTFRYAVDFTMPIGTLITATRSGHVVYILESYSDDDHTAGHENVVIVMHKDSTYARYAHLTTNGALVSIGQNVVPGDSIGKSGNSGSGAAPHLHFDVTNTHTGRSDQTIPFDFKNTIPHPNGLQEGVSYKAFSY